MSWSDFETQVAELFALFGYNTTHDTKLHGGQTDILALSARRNRPSLLVECKFHSDHKNKVGISDVQVFASRVTTARMTGDIDQGYLVTNTDFTSDARGSLQNQPQEKYLFLVTYEELLQSLIDAHNYLRDFATHFENNRYLDRYIDLSVIDTTGIPGTAFDLIPGDRITMMSQEKEVHFSRQVQAIVIEKERLDGLITKGIATRNKISNQLLLNEYRLREFIRRSEQNRYMESHKHRKAYQEMFIRAIRNVFRVV